jgi:thiaminase/transcriptional activator TenA
VFLIEYACLLALAAARGPDLETMTRFATLLKETLETEMNLHRAYAVEFGISRQELERELPAPATRGYTDFLLRVAATGDFAELAAALLPCMWAFSEIGLRLAEQPAPSDQRYALDRDVQLQRICRTGPMVPRSARQSCCRIA